MKKGIFIFMLASHIVFVSASVYGGINMFDGRPPDTGKTRMRKSSALIKAEKAFVKGDYEEVLIIGSSYLTSKTKLDDELQHLTGRALLKLERFDEARNRFSRVINYSDNDEFLDKAHMGLADSYYLEGDYSKAKEYYEKVIRYFPDSNDVSIIYYRLGECYSKLGQKSASREYYDKLVEFYPDSFETKLLKGEKSDVVEYSVQVGSFKRWSNAKKLSDELKTKRFDANIYTAMLGNKRFYRVRVGKFNQLSDALDMARVLQNSGYSVKIYP